MEAATRIYEVPEEIDPKNGHRVLRGVPWELREKAIESPTEFLRDCACISTPAISPFFEKPGKVRGVYRGRDFEGANPFLEDAIMFTPSFSCNDQFRRYLHFDLALTRCACGIAMAHCPGYVIRKAPDGMDVRLPFIYVDFVARIQVDPGEKHDLETIANIPITLREMGFDIGLVTFDRFQSGLIIQRLNSEGIRSELLSIDRTTHKVVLDASADSGLKKVSTNGEILSAWHSLKSAMYSDRLSLPFHPDWEEECSYCEDDKIKQKVRKSPAEGSHFDMVQSVAGAVYNASVNEFPFFFFHEMFDGSVYEEKEEDFYANLARRGVESPAKPVPIESFEDFLDTIPSPELTRWD